MNLFIKHKGDVMEHSMKLLTLLAITLIIVACGPIDIQDPVINTGELNKFNSEAELKAYLEDNQGSQSFGGMDRGLMMADVVMEESLMAAPVAGAVTKSAADDYSTTNVQVQGVDEADFVKNDDKYIYVLANNRLKIIDAYPVEDSEIVSEIEFKGYPRELLLNNDYLVIFLNDNDETMRISEYDFIPRPSYESITKVLVYNIEDRKNPELIETIKQDGNYFQSRMIGDEIWFITNKNTRYYAMPQLRMDSKIIKPDVYYFNNPEDNYQFNTITKLNLNDMNSESKTFLLGYGNTLYVSQNNIYIAYQKNMPYRDYQKDIFFEAVLPLMPSKERNKITSIRNQNLDRYDEWNKIAPILEEFYNTMDEDDLKEFSKDIEEAIQDYTIKRETERRKSIIHKISLDLDYEGRAEVPGQLLNQFSLDEYDGNLRVATTTYLYTRNDNTMYNNVYVLDKDMNLIGELEKLAPDERIYSTRFLGEKLYMVTFKQVDPLFVIDLSNPNNPEVLGELKIPGFSTYLHPYDENHIIGFGKETGTNEWGGTSVKGLKVALFDVSDVNNPEQIDVFVIENAYSEAFNEHKAFLFDKDKELLVFPVRETIEDGKYDERYGYYRDTQWFGAYVLNIDEDGFDLRGKVTHGTDWNDNVRRSLYMDETLYTIGNNVLVMSDLNDLEELNRISLSQENNYPRPIPLEEPVFIE